MRLFTAIDISEAVRDRLERLLSHLRPFAHLKWSPVYNLHVTIKFIGEWPEGDLPKLETALREMEKPPSSSVHVHGLGWFPNAHSPRVFWAGVEGDAALERLARDTDAALEPLGVAKEGRAFSPHLTLARIKQPTPLQPLRQAVAELGPVEFGSFPADRFYLYRSQPGSAGSIYTKISEYPFTE
jgi:2'-5' RNA ligase